MLVVVHIGTYECLYRPDSCIDNRRRESEGDTGDEEVFSCFHCIGGSIHVEECGEGEYHEEESPCMGRDEVTVFEAGIEGY